MAEHSMVVESSKGKEDISADKVSLPHSKVEVGCNRGSDSYSFQVLSVVGSSFVELALLQ